MKFQIVVSLVMPALFSQISFGATASKDCLAQSGLYRAANALALNDFIADPVNSQINETSGSLGISLLNSEVIEKHGDGSYTDQITISSRYFNVADAHGVKVRNVTYTLDTKSNCDGFTIRNRQSEASLPIGVPSRQLSEIAHLILTDYLKDEVNLPLNTKSGAVSFRLMTPTICNLQGWASANLVRYVSSASRIVKRTTSYKIALAKMAIVSQVTTPGGALQDMCL